jgi:integrase
VACAGLSAKTLSNRLSTLRTFAFWIGKRGLVETATRAGLDLKGLRVSQVATRDKSWCFRGVDVAIVIAAAEKRCPYVAASIALMAAFGLRRKESVMSLPHEGVVPIEQAQLYDDRPAGVTHVFSVTGAKNGRPREVPITTEEQWAALRRAQCLVAPGQPMGRPGKELKTNLGWMDHVLAGIGITRKKLGVTAHGLRHQRFNDIFERITREPSPVRGGKPVDRALDEAARENIAEIAGHGPTQVVSAYCGSPLRGRAERTADPAATTEEAMPGSDAALGSPRK